MKKNYSVPAISNFEFAPDCICAIQTGSGEGEFDIKSVEDIVDDTDLFGNGSLGNDFFGDEDFGGGDNAW